MSASSSVENSPSNQEGESSNGSTFPTLVIGDGTCQSVLMRGPRKGDKCGKCCVSLSTYCRTHISRHVTDKDRLPVLVYGDQYLVVDKHIIIDKNYEIYGVATGVKTENKIVTVEDVKHPYEMTLDDIDWCIEMGLIQPILVKSARKR